MNSVLAILNIFFNPAASVRYQRAQGKLGWLPPILFATVISGGIFVLLRPLLEQAQYNDLLDQMSAQRAREAMGSANSALTFSVVMTPIMLAIMLAVSSALVLGFGAIAEVRAVFTEVFTLLAHCTLVPFAARIAQFIVIKQRGELKSMSGLEPAFGLDLLLKDDAARLLHALLNYFSIFTIWYIVILAIGYAALTGTSKAKAFGITCPVWIVGLLLALAASLPG